MLKVHRRAVIRWVARIIMKTNGQQGLIADIFVGLVGAFMSGYFPSARFNVGSSHQGDFTFPTLLVSLVARSSGW